MPNHFHGKNLHYFLLHICQATFFSLKKNNSKEKRGTSPSAKSSSFATRNADHLWQLTFDLWQLTFDLWQLTFPVFLVFFFPPRLGFMSLVVSQHPKTRSFWISFFRLQQCFSRCKGKITPRGVERSPCGWLVNEPMEVGGLEWLQEPFQPRSSGSSGLYFFFGSGENWEDLSSLERQKEFI